MNAKAARFFTDNCRNEIVRNNYEKSLDEKSLKDIFVEIRAAASKGQPYLFVTNIRPGVIRLLGEEGYKVSEWPDKKGHTIKW